MKYNYKILIIDDIIDQIVTKHSIKIKFTETYAVSSGKDGIVGKFIMGAKTN
jgi:hypothetical protein